MKTYSGFNQKNNDVLGRLKRFLPLLLLLFLAAFVLIEPFQIKLLSTLYPGLDRYTHSRVALSRMTLTHLLLTLGATLLSAITGILTAIYITSPRGKCYLSMVMKVNAFIQTFPPSAVIILAFPFIGFGWKPTLLALFLYSLFPVTSNTAIGILGIDEEVLDAATAMGMTERQKLLMVKLPQAKAMIITGLRHSFILNLGTAAIGAVIGAGGLGTIIISGLTLQNSALVFSGTLVIVGMALLVEIHLPSEPNRR